MIDPVEYDIDWWRDPAVPLDLPGVVIAMQRSGFAYRLCVPRGRGWADVDPVQLAGEAVFQLWLPDLETGCVGTVHEDRLSFDLAGMGPEEAEVVVHAVLAVAATWPGTRRVVVGPDELVMTVREDGTSSVRIDPASWLLPVNR